jgi:hypothetical protein
MNSPEYNPNGTYHSQDGTFTVTLTNSTPGGQFDGTYSAKLAPQGEQTFAVTGQWRYVGSKSSYSNASHALSFVAVVRPEDANTWNYSIQDAWSGFVTAPGHLRLTGVRGYLDAKGEHFLHNLGTWNFSA